MKKEIREVDKKQGIVQITTFDERWYVKSITDKKTGLPEHKFVPSVTWIAGFYPKGIPFYKWLAQKGWDEAEAIKQAAGDKGSKVHQAIADLIDDKEVKMDAKYPNPTTGQEEELKVEEYEAIMSFTNWFNLINPEVIARENVVFNENQDYAGTIDLLCRIDGDLWIIDFKTGQYIWPEYEIQISAYKEAVLNSKIEGIEKDKEINLAILQIGYRRNKNAYKFSEIEDKFKLFLSAKEIWQNEVKGIEPKQKDYPLSLILNKKVEDKKVKTTKK